MVLSRVACVFSCLIFAALPQPCAAETVLLDFHSPSCGPCQQMRPVINRLAAAGFRVHGIDIQRDPQAAARFKVTLVPTLIVMEDGQEVSRSVGLTSFQQLRERLTRSSPPRPLNRPMPQGQSPDTFAAPIAAISQPAKATNDLAVPRAGRIVAIQNSASVAAAAPLRQVASNPFPIAQAGQPTSAGGSAEDNRRLIEVTVKVAVQDSEGTSTGTGTIVDARSGEALVLTCGHLFRTSAGKGPITVTLFQAGPSGAEVRTTANGRLIDYDLERDLALVSLRTEFPIQPATIAQAGTPLTPGAVVATVGCNGGENPTIVRSKITANGRYQGPPNVEVAGAPVEGRSGGGLFNAKGQLIGVCFAADPEANEGLYASLPSILEKLDSLGLSMVYQPRATTPPLAAALSQSMEADPSFAVRGQEPSPSSSPVETPIARTPPNAIAASLSPAEQATLEEIQRRGLDSEVICIIRPKNADGKSEVITLNSASPQFVRALTEPTAAAQTPLRR